MSFVEGLFNGARYGSHNMPLMKEIPFFEKLGGILRDKIDAMKSQKQISTNILERFLKLTNEHIEKTKPL